MKKLNLTASKLFFTFGIIAVSLLLISSNEKESPNNETISGLSLKLTEMEKELQNLKSSKNIEAFSADPFLGEVILFAGNFAPRGWAYCDGQLLSISKNTALFSILGTVYGGDGRTTFALPNLKENNPNGVKYIIATSGMYPSRS